MSNRDLNECPVCYHVPDRWTVWVGCGHHYCLPCIKKLQVCAICRLDPDDPSKPIIEELRNRVQAQEAQISNLKAQASAAGRQVDEHTTTLQALQSQVDSYKERLEYKKYAIQCLKEDLRVAREEVDAIKRDRDLQQEALTKEKGYAAQLRMQVKAVQQEQQDNLRSMEQRWASRVNQQQPAIDALQADKLALVAERDAARQQVQELQVQLHTALMAHNPDLTPAALMASLTELGKAKAGPLLQGAHEYLKQTYKQVYNKQVNELRMEKQRTASLTQQLEECQEKLRLAKSARTGSVPAPPDGKRPRLADVTNAAMRPSAAAAAGAEEEDAYVLLSSDEEGEAAGASQPGSVGASQPLPRPVALPQTSALANEWLGQHGTGLSFASRPRALLRGPDGRGGQCLVAMQGEHRINLGTLASGLRAHTKGPRKQSTMDRFVKRGPS